ncbi:hypothetical protein HS7_08620 [Sulfolobales archaeon HS-7]|nr:hypothetical protein HS7_08620 [Sulfolobales archaeon HS-7]
MDVFQTASSKGLSISQIIDVSERPGGKPFAKEAEYSYGDLFWGKIHQRVTGDIYLLIITKLIQNWKNKVQELKIKGEIVDAVGGLLWLKESESLDDIDYMIEYIKKLKEDKAKSASKK